MQKKDTAKPEQSIQRAEEYLANSISRVEPVNRLFIDYLQRKFGLNAKLGVGESPIDLQENPELDPSGIDFLARIAYPDKIVRKVSIPVEGVALTNVYSANCDHIPLPNNYWQTMQKSVAEGGYSLTHVTLAFAFMRDNGCEVPQSATGLDEEAIPGLVQIASDYKTEADLKYEAIAFLMMSGRRDLVQTDWIKQIIEQQRADGSWSLSLSKSEPDGHATLLALWALLEHSRPDTPHEPLIRRPAISI